MVKNKGVHPSAVSISFDEMDDSCPVELTSDKKGLVSSYDMNWVSIFNVKLDVLGLRSVSVVHDACKKIGIKLEDIDLNNNFIYQQLQDLNVKSQKAQRELSRYTQFIQNYELASKILADPVEMERKINNGTKHIMEDIEKLSTTVDNLDDGLQLQSTSN